MTIERQHISERMSRIVKYNGLVYLSGQVPKDANADITEQTTTMLDKVDELLLAAGSSREHMLSVTIFLKTMNDFAAMNAVWDAWVPKGYAPARTCVEGAMAREELLVEIAVTAAVR